MSYVLNTEAERAEMLQKIGVGEIKDLFRDVPEEFRYPDMDLPDAMSEVEVLQELRDLSELNADLDHFPSFLGAGAYRHYLPSVVDHLAGRAEFYTLEASY